VIIGFGLSVAWAGNERRCRSRAHWAALRASIVHIGGTARGFIKADIAAPLYRLPTRAFETSLPALLADGALNEEDSRALLEFVSQVETLNRGLDRAQDQFDRFPLNTNPEHARNLIKAEKLDPENQSAENRYTKAREVVDRHLK